MDRRAYEQEFMETIARIARPAMADDSKALEYRLRDRIDRAVEEMRQAIAQVNTDSTLLSVSAQAFEDFVADEILSQTVWEEKLCHAAKDW